MKRIVIVTATRAEYGLLKPIMIRMLENAFFDAKIVVTGMHLSSEFGYTIKEIERDEIPIDKKIEILLSSDSHVSISKSMGLAMISFSEYFEECKPDGIVVLGDRFETFAVCATATNARIPIFHLHGGEATEGLIDEAIRHSITKMSYLHFASTDEYRRRIIQMGESPDRVFNVGALGVENALSVPLMNKEKLEESLGLSLGKRYAVGTFHPVTLENSTAENQTKALIDSISDNQEITFLFTKANADTDGRIINKMLSEYANKNDNLYLVDSLGLTRYLSALKNALFVIGNSSSGLIEAPSFKIPTIDIGDRQKGRITADTVIHCEPNKQAICQAISKALDRGFVEKCKIARNPYGNGITSQKVTDIIKDFFERDLIDIKKKFYDIYFEV